MHAKCHEGNKPGRRKTKMQRLGCQGSWGGGERTCCAECCGVLVGGRPLWGRVFGLRPGGKGPSLWLLGERRYQTEGRACVQRSCGRREIGVGKEWCGWSSDSVSEWWDPRLERGGLWPVLSWLPLRAKQSQEAWSRSLYSYQLNKLCSPEEVSGGPESLQQRLSRTRELSLQ